jgi:hypothetical protein
MAMVDAFWKLDAHSDRELLEGLKIRVGNGRQLLAEVLAHLGELEERRLHLEAGYSSMFAYCVSRLRMSEDEACRRIDVARLARRYPALFPHLSTGQISLSAAALLKPYLSNERVLGERAVTECVSPDGALLEHAMGGVDLLITAVSGKSVQQAREALAALFPRPDVEASIRKLPDRARAGHGLAMLQSVASDRATISQAPARHAGTCTPDPDGVGASAATLESVTSTDHPVGGSTESVAATKFAPARDAMASEPPRVVPHASSVDSPSNALNPLSIPTSAPFHHVAATSPDRTSIAGQAPQPFVLESPRAERLEPLSAGRYRVQFTADAALKEKLERARDLMRHALPSGDLAALIARSLDLLIEQLMKRRFGTPSRRKNKPHTSRNTSPATSSKHPRTAQPTSSKHPTTQQPTSIEPPTAGLTSSKLPDAERPTSIEQSTAQPTSSKHPTTQQPTTAELTSSKLPGAERPTSIERSTTGGPLTSTEQLTVPTQLETISLELPFTPKAAPTAPPEGFNEAATARCPEAPPNYPAATRVDRATRRAVFERDGLRCAWRSADGVRCEARAWLEHDHIRPRAKGGNSSANNGRLLCRAHNRLAAENEFGREHVEQAIANQRAKRRPIPSNP